jgi:hypothetical protein
MLKKHKTVVAGIVISGILFFACFAILLSLGQISKAFAQNMTGSGGNASVMMANKTAANSDVLMTKVRSMGIGNSTIAASRGSSNMTNQRSG